MFKNEAACVRVCVGGLGWEEKSWLDPVFMLSSSFPHSSPLSFPSNSTNSALQGMGGDPALSWIFDKGAEPEPIRAGTRAERRGAALHKPEPSQGRGGRSRGAGRLSPSPRQRPGDGVCGGDSRPPRVSARTVGPPGPLPLEGSPSEVSSRPLVSLPRGGQGTEQHVATVPCRGLGFLCWSGDSRFGPGRPVERRGLKSCAAQQVPGGAVAALPWQRRRGRAAASRLPGDRGEITSLGEGAGLASPAPSWAGWANKERLCSTSVSLCSFTSVGGHLSHG
jgi:hypothetical protein